MSEFGPKRQPDSHYPGLNQIPAGANWPDSPRPTPRARLWPIGATVVVLVGTIVAIVLLASR